MAEGIPTRLSREEARRFGLVVGPAFLLLGALLWWRGRPLAGQVFGGIGIALILLAVMLPRALVPVHRAWMRMAMVISRVTTPIFLGCVYFGVITPIGVVRRLFGHDAVKSKRTGNGFWVPRDSRANKPDMTHQF